MLDGQCLIDGEGVCAGGCVLECVSLRRSASVRGEMEYSREIECPMASKIMIKTSKAMEST